MRDSLPDAHQKESRQVAMRANSVIRGGLIDHFADEI
jgi:hypothetical protein